MQGCDRVCICPECRCRGGRGGYSYSIEVVQRERGAVQNCCYAVICGPPVLPTHLLAQAVRKVGEESSKHDGDRGGLVFASMLTELNGGGGRWVEDGLKTG